MSKPKMFAMTALTAATIGVGSLAASPSASAARDCDALYFTGTMYHNLGNTAYDAGSYNEAIVYYTSAIRYLNEASNCYS